jgi:hypothetical protein
MKKINLNIVPEDPFLVLIALNPTEEALKNNAVFSRDESFWNLLRDAGLINDVKNVPLSKRAKEVFGEQKHSAKKIGFADLLPLIFETDSSKVKVPKGAAIQLLKDVPNINKAHKIGLMGQKVVDAFAKDFGLKRWSKLEVINHVRQFGKIGDIGKIEIYAMPFPINNNIAEKYKIYRMLK